MAGLAGLLLLIAALGALWPWLLMIAVVILIIRMIVRQAHREDVRLREESVEHAGLEQRADTQNALALAGDPRGVYGDWPPAPSIGGRMASVSDSPISSGASFDVVFDDLNDARRVAELMDGGLGFQQALDLLELRPNEHFTVTRTDMGPDGRG
ncbi:MAG: hypothetical protein AB1925_12375 [Actinomycetota bacterium]